MKQDVLQHSVSMLGQRLGAETQGNSPIMLGYSAINPWIDDASDFACTNLGELDLAVSLELVRALSYMSLPNIWSVSSTSFHAERQLGRFS